VLAFSTIYDWRLNGNAVHLTDRMNGVASGRRINFTCPLAAPPKQ
jgi:soluble lytic murein transglycosylase